MLVVVARAWGSGIPGKSTRCRYRYGRCSGLASCIFPLHR